MKTFPLSVELSSFALESVSKPLSPVEWLNKVKSILAKRPDILGSYTGSRLSRRAALGHDLFLNEYRLDYEKSSLLFQLVNFSPRGEWEVRGFRFISEPGLN